MDTLLVGSGGLLVFGHSFGSGPGLGGFKSWRWRTSGLQSLIWFCFWVSGSLVLGLGYWWMALWW